MAHESLPNTINQYVNVGGTTFIAGCIVDQSNDDRIAAKLEAICCSIGLDAESDDIDAMLETLNDCTDDGYLWGYHPEESGTIMLMKEDWYK